MDNPGGGMLGRLTERIIGYVALGLIALGCFALYRMGPAGRTALWEGIWRTGFWVLWAAAVPWTARLFIGRLLEVGANWAGVAVIAAFSLLDVVVGLVLLGGLPATGWGWVAAIAALGVASTYNYLVAEYLSEQAGG
jgi:hypothetical protein